MNFDPRVWHQNQQNGKAIHDGTSFTLPVNLEEARRRALPMLADTIPLLCGIYFKG